MNYWWIQQDPNSYRSFELLEVDWSVGEFVESFRAGNSLAQDWTAPKLKLFEAEGEAEKPIGDFPTIVGTVPLVVSERALSVLLEVIRESVEVLPLQVNEGQYHCLNIEVCDCLDPGRSVVKRFSSTGRIMHVESYHFKEDWLEGIHIFRLPEEPLRRVFVDEVFKTRVEANDLRGLVFRPLE